MDDEYDFSPPLTRRRDRPPAAAEDEEEEVEFERRTRARKTAPAIDVDTVMQRVSGDMEQMENLHRAALESVRDAFSIEEAQAGVGGAIMGFYLSAAPYELVVKIALSLPLASVKALCRTNKQFFAVCDEDWFWGQKARHDFGKDVFKKWPTWRESYLWLTRQPRGSDWTTFVMRNGLSFDVKWKLRYYEDDPCFPVYYETLGLLPFPDVAEMYLYGSDGYPVIAKRENQPYDDVLKLVISPDFGLRLWHDDDFTVFYPRGPRVTQQLQSMYGKNNIDAWRDRCGREADEGWYDIPMPHFVWDNEDIDLSMSVMKLFTGKLWIGPSPEQQ